MLSSVLKKMRFLALGPYFNALHETKCSNSTVMSTVVKLFMLLPHYVTGESKNRVSVHLVKLYSNCRCGSLGQIIICLLID